MTTWLLEVEVDDLRTALAHVAPFASAANPSPWDRIRLHVLFEGGTADLHLLAGSDRGLAHGAIAHVSGRTLRRQDDRVFFGTDLARSVGASLPASGLVQIGVDPGAVSVRHVAGGATVSTSAVAANTSVGCFPTGAGWTTVVPAARWTRGRRDEVFEVFEDDYSTELADAAPATVAVPPATVPSTAATAPGAPAPTPAKARPVVMPSLPTPATDPAPRRTTLPGHRTGHLRADGRR
ncbi:hypothetical protein DEI99_013500 [Curtobacterium sp. MCLR17_036]|uniref:hypothetical protein n=1 Tax=Curtobacterium sp. MCLR17_036 TaxID=2175620 RepID=UPI0011B4E420|nr:hypothetical protein [Curtobacterium sp. MCLR17_036]WIE64239.1 hypothetical protein DEI99_013500 [Curtobacterium sp. MCLR17_036]